MSGVDLVTFLRARLDEIQEDVSDSRSLIPGELHWSMPDWLDRNYLFADVAAKRRIVEAHADPKHYCAPGPIDRDGYSWYEAGEKRWADIPCLHLRLLAAPFAQHPDFDPAWAVPGEQS